MRVLIAGGGTGGHLYPGLAVAHELRQREPACEIAFVGTAGGLEARVVPREGFPLDVIRVAGLKGKSPAALARGLLLLPVGALDAWRVLSRRRPDVVVGVGGFASGPVLLLAAWRGIPTLLLEQNAVPGVTNRLLARWVRAAALNFEEARRYFPRTGFVAGNPVRSEFLAGAEGADDRHSSPLDAVRVLIVGGSQGAHAINVAMVEAAARLAAAGVPLAIVHQTGKRDLDLVRDAYRRADVAARVEAFLDDMAREMRAADILVCRAGATTLAEIAAIGRPAVLVPLPTAADDHQRRNAQVLARAGAALVIEQPELTGERLAEALAALARDGARRVRMAAAVRSFGRPDAAARIADRVLELAAAG